MEAKFRFVFSQRRAMRLKRLSLPTACSMRARGLQLRHFLAQPVDLELFRLHLSMARKRMLRIGR
jgi:hypothetical protein